MSEREILHDYFSRLGRKSGRARMKKIAPEERKRIASEAAKARWARWKAENEPRKKKSK